MRTIVCLNCEQHVVKPNKKLKHLQQHYCGKVECQRARKLKFDRNKYKANESFRMLKLDKVREKRCERRLNNPQCFSEDQRDYREKHPGYVLQNRIKQRERYIRGVEKRGVTAKHSNPDALMLQLSDNEVISPIFPKGRKKVVNPDALMLQQLDNEQVYALFAIDCKKIVNPDAIMMKQIEMLSFTDTKPMFVRLL